MSTVLIEELEPQSADAGVPAHYGDPMREQRTLDTAVGLVDRSNRDVVAVPGVERASWLHTLTTQYLSDLRAGQGTELLVLSPHGHVEHHAMVTEDGTTAWLDTEPGAGAGLLRYLEMMRFFTRVEPRDATTEIAVYSLVGPEAAATAARLLGVELAEPRIFEVPGPKFAAGTVPPEMTARYDVQPFDGGLARRVPLGVDLLLPRSHALDVLADVPRAGLWAYEAVRVAHKIPRLGWETDHRTIPAEAELLAPAVHLDKGCYRGQETVARVHHLGRPPRRLELLHLDGVATDQPPVQGTPVMLAGREVGFIGTAVRHHELGMIALAVLKKNVAADAHLTVGESAAAIDAG
ncbi:folate-binding protein YgfZ [Actinoplanes sp. N902-109]|uniref:CAF17-like 4Fe-4S cluster assembly/insertion protein YgfZ n=1 Tax=Actinoplanes sp. (strain N902-109) TaxID=649831 RepID=UPI0003294C49|nr:folate-binding protein YgfZ [Actinoplanes sp. N902-109]AGL21256.1 glycine cleavage T protein (aminomethyl transferase) [Actinoplanes sp. N902-109]